MRNPALLAASLAGRPLLMRADAVPQYAQLLGMELRHDQGRSPFATLLNRARRALTRADREDAAPTGPVAYMPTWMGVPDAVGETGWALKDGLAVICIDGPLMAEGFGWGDCWYHGYDTIRAALEECLADTRVLAIMLRWSSPGGVCAPGLPELVKFMGENNAAAGGKLIWSFCDYAYSAAYWGACPSDQMVAPREGGVGSIGAVIAHCDMSGAYAQEGFVVTPIQFGAKKTDGAAYKPLSDTAKADMQAEVDQAGRWFVADVVAHRPNLTEAQVLATQAGCYYGDSDQEALSGLKQGLIDQVLTERDAFSALRELANRPLRPAAPPQPAATLETDMKRSDALAAARAAGLSADQLAAFEAQLPAAEATEPAADGNTAEPGDDEGDDTKDSPDAGSSTVSGGAAADALTPDGKTVLAIMDLPEAKGREKLARTLAGSPGMTLATAKAALAAAPKATALQPEDPNVEAAGGAAPTGDFAEGAALGKAFASMRKPQRR